MRIETQVLGKTTDGSEVHQYTLEAAGLRVSAMSYGATLTGVWTPDRAGELANITLSLDALEDYLGGHPHLGSVAGRFANRIARGRFTLDGQSYSLATNNGPNHLHGGCFGFDKKVWRGEPLEQADRVGVRFSLVSPDGDEGYPGTLTTQVIYALTETGEMHMEYLAETTKPTIINLTNHAYWNLAGAGSGDVEAHVLTIHAAVYIPVDDTSIPTGEILPVAGTPMDFREPHTIGERIGLVGIGYDHCYVVDGRPGNVRPAARVVDPASGRWMEVLTTQPGVQFYTGNYLTGKLGSRAGKKYDRHHGFCLETQHFPDSPNQPQFPSVVLRPGQRYREVTIHRFGSSL